MVTFPRPVRYIWYSPETSKKIVETFQAEGPGACLRFEPYISDQDGELKLDWAIVGGVSKDNGAPGGNDSLLCPPICP